MSIRVNDSVLVDEEYEDNAYEEFLKEMNKVDD